MSRGTLLSLFIKHRPRWARRRWCPPPAIGRAWGGRVLRGARRCQRAVAPSQKLSESGCTRMYEGFPLSGHSSILRALTSYAPSECKKRSSQRYQVLVLGEGGNTKKEKGKRNQDANVIWHPPSPRILRFWGTGQGEYATTSPMASHTGPAWPATVTADVGRISGRFPPVAAGRLLLSAHTAAISWPTFLQPRAALKCYVSCSA